MDRTSDFVKITVLFDTGTRRPQTHRPLSHDARRAQQITDQLRQQELFLRDLQELVSKKSIIGDDPTAQIASLTDLLKKELSAIEKNIQTFHQSVMAQRGRHEQHHQAHFSIICASLKARCAKSAKAFHFALQQHTATIRERSSRRSKFSHGGASPMVQINAPLFARTSAVASPQIAPFPPGSAPTQPNGGAPGNPFASKQRPNGIQPGPPPPGPMGNNHPTASFNNDLPMPGAGLRRRAGNIGSSPFMQQATTPGGSVGPQRSMQYLPRQDAQTRYNNAVQVESTIVEITGMYTRMATMVAEQREMISRIDDDMDIAQTNVEAAHGELMKLYNMVSGNRSLILKIFLVLVLVIFLFVVVF